MSPCPRLQRKGPRPSNPPPSTQRLDQQASSGGIGNSIQIPRNHLHLCLGRHAVAASQSGQRASVRGRCSILPRSSLLPCTLRCILGGTSDSIASHVRPHQSVHILRLTSPLSTSFCGTKTPQLKDASSAFSTRGQSISSSIQLGHAFDGLTPAGASGNA